MRRKNGEKEGGPRPLLISPKPPKPPKTLYHYCGVAAFHGVITSKRLWLSNATFTNDYTEHKWLTSMALERIEEKRRSTKNHTALDRCIDLLSREKTPYIGCFAAGRDMLSQWRAYSEDGAGFAIGFSGKYWSEVVAAGNNVRFSLQKTSYDVKEHKAAVKSVVDSAVSRSNRSVFAIAIHARMLTIHGATCKNAGFEEEREWRLVFNPQYPKLKELYPYKNYNDVEPSPLQFRPSNGMLVPYYAVPFEADAITEVYLGPKNHARDDHGFLKLFLEQNDYNVRRIKIINSAATYR